MDLGFFKRIYDLVLAPTCSVPSSTGMPTSENSFIERDRARAQPELGQVLPEAVQVRSIAHVPHDAS